MKYIIIVIKLIVVSFLLNACKNDKFLIKGEGNNVENTRSIEAFTSVSLSMDASVEVIKDTAFRIELSGQQNILNVIETKVSGQQLKICLQKGKSIRKHNAIRIRVFMKDISAVNLSGSGFVEVNENFNSQTLHATVSGSGKVELKGKIIQKFSSNVSGSGQINYIGQSHCLESNFIISGSGDINAEWLKTDRVEVNVSGSGKTVLYAEDYLNVNISGSGKVSYRGNPELKSKISGSGKVNHIQ